MTKENFPQMLKEWRKANGLSQHGLAEKIGVAKSAVSFYERGIYCPSTETAVKLAELGFDGIPDGLVHRVRCTELKNRSQLRSSALRRNTINLCILF